MKQMYLITLLFFLMTSSIFCPFFCYTTHSVHKACFYEEPSGQHVDPTFFQDLLSRSDKTTETFKSILRRFNEHKNAFYQIKFKFPVKKEHVNSFTKVLKIKAEQAHRFIPVMKKCEFVEKSHLGFLRRVDLDGKGPSVQDRVVVDPNSNTILFIQQWHLGPNNEKLPGNFAALNGLTEQDGNWYFEGCYLYPNLPPADAVEGQMLTFRETYDNMLSFIEQNDVAAVYNALQSIK